MIDLAALLPLMAAALVTAALPGSAGERETARAWAGAALLGEPKQVQLPAPGLDVRRQDFGEFSLRKSVMNTPLQIGEKHYDHGLGTHSVSEVIVRLPEPGEVLEAEVGIDNNYDTAGVRGSVIFAAEVGGKEVFRSDVLKGGRAPVPVRIALGGATEFVLRVLDDGDGPGWDQSDWAAARVTFASGKSAWLDEMPLTQPGAELGTDVPFSFVYDGKPSAQLLPSWKRTQTRQPDEKGRERYAITYADPTTGLEVACELTLFREYPAIEWVLRLRNGGTADTPVIQDVRALDLRATVPTKGDLTLHHAHGSTCGPTDFLPVDQPLPATSEITLAPNGGRSSDGRLPFFNLQWPAGGLVGAIGWSGQWALRAHRDAGSQLTLQAGQQTTHLKLRPGESIRTPRVLLVMWQGDDPLRGHNLLRRTLLAHYVPRHQGEIIVPPVTQNTWFTYNSGNGVTEENQLAVIKPMPGMGIEGYWLDAGWFEGGWPAGAGSWVPRKDAFPRGLKPLGDAAHERGLKFVIWFEPERVNMGSRIGKEHPEWVLRSGEGDGLFNLGDPAARQWLTDYLSKCIEDWGIDIYRNDFNIDPLRFWQAADTPDRQGMAEARYIEGLYTMWDELRARHPGLAIDNCASGGRRIDLETISRSFPLWRSDTQCCGKAMPVQDQVQTAGLSLYVPLHSAGVWDCDPYPFRSVATTGTNFCMNTRRKDFSEDLARRAVAEAKALRPLYLGDYYPLLTISTEDTQWCGWQFDRPELGRGFAMFFRRAKSPYVAVRAGLRGLDPKATYEVSVSETYDPGKKRKMTGAELAKLQVEIASAPGSVLVSYQVK